MRSKEAIRNGVTNHDFTAPLHEWIIQIVREELREKINDGPVLEEYNRMTRYLQSKYREDFKQT